MSRAHGGDERDKPRWVRIADSRGAVRRQSQLGSGLPLRGTIALGQRRTSRG